MRGLAVKNGAGAGVAKRHVTMVRRWPRDDWGKLAEAVDGQGSAE